MHEVISMPDGRKIGSIMDDGANISYSTSREVMTWIIKNVPILANGEELRISRTVAGWDVRIVDQKL